MAVIGDSPDRETDSALVLAVEHATPHVINFMATHDGGPISVAMLRERLDELGIPPMIAHPGDDHDTGIVRIGSTLTVTSDSTRFEAMIAEPRQVARPRPARGDARRSPAVRPGNLPGHARLTLDRGTPRPPRYREGAWRLSMSIANARGDDDGVLARFRRCENALADIGLSPAPATRQLLNRLRR